MGAEQPGNIGLITCCRFLEEGLNNFPFPTAFIRAGGFFDNWVPHIKQAAQMGKIESLENPPSRKVPMVATDDVGACVARLMTDDKWSGKRVIENGNLYSYEDCARALSQVFGKEIKVMMVPRDQYASKLEAFGIPKEIIAPYEEIYDAINNGLIHFGVPGTESVPGKITPVEYMTRMRTELRL